MALRIIGIASVACMLASCLPEDKTTERGSVYMHMRAAQLHDQVGLFDVTFERITIIGGADLFNCHSVFYIEHPPGPLAVIDLTQPFTIERRSISDARCQTFAGFITNPDAEPWVGPGVTDEEVALLQPQVGVSGGVYLRVRFDYPAGARQPTSTRHLELIARGVVGTASVITEVPRGDKSDLYYAYDTHSIAGGLIQFLGWDANHDGTVKTEELTDAVADRLRGVLSDQWKQVPPPAADAGP